MTKRPKVSSKKDNRTPIVAVRMPERITVRVDAWMEREGFSTRSEAIKRLIEKALDCAEEAS